MAQSSFYAIFAPFLSGSLTPSLTSDWERIHADSDGAKPNSADYWSLVKRQFFIEDGLIYLNTGGFGPTLRAAYDAVCKNYFEIGANYNKAFRSKMMGEAVPKFIGRLADFIGATPDEVALTSGTTEAMNYIANGLDLNSGDEILTTRHEHLGGIYPWLLKAKRQGLVVKQLVLKSPPANEAEFLEQFERSITPRTRVLSFCHVQYTDGAILPVKKLCDLARRKGIMTVVDGAQSMGMLNFKIRDLGCDFYAASFHKWLCSPYGCGLLYVRDEMRDRLWPTVALSYSGWDSVDRDGNPSGKTDISYAPNYPKALLKYSSNIEYYGSLYWTIALAMDFQNLIGRDLVQSRILALGSHAHARLKEIPGLTSHSPDNPALRSGLISFRLRQLGTPELFFKLKEKRKIVSRFIQHPGMNFDVSRFSTHIFNSPAEIDEAVSIIKEIANGGVSPGLGRP
jgi:isopenicillin-N epimerase